VLVKLLIIAVSCACVSAIGVAGDPVLLPMTLLAARFAILASVMPPAATSSVVPKNAKAAASVTSDGAAGAPVGLPNRLVASSF